jgi:hypothetical protein
LLPQRLFARKLQGREMCHDWPVSQPVNSPPIDSGQPWLRVKPFDGWEAERIRLARRYRRIIDARWRELTGL